MLSLGYAVLERQDRNKAIQLIVTQFKRQNTGPLIFSMNISNMFDVFFCIILLFSICKSQLVKYMSQTPGVCLQMLNHIHAALAYQLVYMHCQCSVLRSADRKLNICSYYRYIRGYYEYIWHYPQIVKYSHVYINNSSISTRVPLIKSMPSVNLNLFIAKACQILF